MLLRYLIGLALATQALALYAATPDEENAFKAAVRAFEDRFYERAASQFADFIQAHPESDLYAEAKAFGLRAKAHDLASKEEFQAAAEHFRRLRSEFPNSPNHLEFVVNEAWNEYRLQHLDTVIQLLGSDDAPFRLTATIRPNDPIALPLVVSGQLLQAQAYLDKKDYLRSKEALDRVTDMDLRTEFSWRRRMILTRIQLATGELEMARQNASALMDLASATGIREWIGETAALQGEVLIANSLPEAAIVAYKRNLAPGTPAHRHREAWFKVIELNLAQRDPRSVIQQLEGFVEDYPEDDSLDVALLTLGELNLQLYYEENLKPEQPEGEETLTPSDFLHESRITLERLINDYPSSELLPEAQYHRGWCYWELGESMECITAFALAAEQLPKSLKAAVARFKLADAHYVLGQHQEALENYKQITESYRDDPQVRDAFLDQVFYQTLRAAIAANDEESARTATNLLIAYYPDSLLANAGKMLEGQHMIHIDNVSRAREIFHEMTEIFSDFPLKPEVDFAIAYTLELEGDWPKATARYSSWLKDYPEHPYQARAAYAVAWCTGQQGLVVQAADKYRQFLADHGDHELALNARLWIGNYHFNRHEFDVAETQYAAILQETEGSNPQRRLAALMAGRASFRQTEYQKAIRYLSGLQGELVDVEGVDPEFHAKVVLNLGDAHFEKGKQSTPIDRDAINEAKRAFSNAGVLHPDSPLAAIAFGRFGDASYFLEEYQQAIENYQGAMDLPQSDITTRTQAEVALGMVYERQAEQALSAGDSFAAKQTATRLTNQALVHYLNIVYLKNLREGESYAPFWLEEAGIRAGVILAARNDTETAKRLYQRLSNLLPTQRSQWDQLALALDENRAP